MYANEEHFGTNTHHRPIAISVADAVRLSGLGRTTIWSLIKNNRLQTIRIGRRTLVLLSSLESLLSAHTSPPVAADSDRQPD